MKRAAAIGLWLALAAAAAPADFRVRLGDFTVTLRLERYVVAQRARVEGLAVAGKTGSVRADAGKLVAWFPGFASSRAPEAVVTVMLAARVLSAWRAGEL